MKVSFYEVCEFCGASHRNYRPRRGCVRCGRSDFVKSKTPKIKGIKVLATDLSGELLDMSLSLKGFAMKKTTGTKSSTKKVVKKKATGKKVAKKKATKKKKTAKKKTPKLPPAKCKCGCGELTSGGKSLFRQGHDARFHGRVRKMGDGRMTMDDVIKALGKRGAYAIPFYKAG